jgi:transposase InsO family protein
MVATAPPVRAGTVPFEVRLRIVQAVMRGTSHDDAATVFGVSTPAVSKYMRLFQHGGVEALRPRLAGAAAAAVEKAKGRQAAAADAIAAAGAAAGDARRKAVVGLRGEHPEWGTRRISAVLARFAGLGVPETTVRRFLHEAGLIAPVASTSAREHGPRRFERAEPNQLWQSDIFTFELRRGERLYLAGFMDDHSRYVLSFALAHHQKGSLVIEAIERAIADYGEPREVLTDQGRQYTAWRGETEFEQLLRRRGIAHVKSRPQHPQTLGKIERFWKTLWDEFLSRVVFADYADCVRRLGLYVQHYNFQRPHQGLDGMVPADRFFRAAAHVRAAIERQVQANALRLAQEKPLQKPFYLVGRLGDQDLSIAASGGALRVQVGEGEAQTIAMTKEADDGSETSRVFRVDEEASETHDGAGGEVDIARAATRAPGATDAALADRQRGAGSGSAATVSAGALGAVGGEAGFDGDRGIGDLATALLSTGDARAAGHAGGAGAGRGERGDGSRGEPGGARGDARGQGDAPGAGEAAAGATALSGTQGSAGRADGGAGDEAAVPQARLAERWRRTLEVLDERDEGDGDLGSAGGGVSGGFDPDDGWRDDAVSWRRKLAGANAPTDRGYADHDVEGGHGEEAQARRDAELRRQAGGSGDGGDGGARGTGARGAREGDDDQRGVGAGGHRAREHADPGASSGARDAGGAGAAADGPDTEATARARAGDGERGAQGAAGEAGGAAAGGGRGDGRGGGDHSPPAWPSAQADQADDELVGALEALLGELDDGDDGPDGGGAGPGARASDFQRGGGTGEDRDDA